VRQAARKKLDAVADTCEAKLRAAALKASPEVSRAIQAVLEASQRSRRKPEGEKLRQYRAVQILEGIATPEARDWLAKLASGAPRATLTEDATLAQSRGKPPTTGASR
jgi:hypothetical protein